MRNFLITNAVTTTTRNTTSYFYLYAKREFQFSSLGLAAAATAAARRCSSSSSFPILDIQPSPAPVSNPPPPAKKAARQRVASVTTTTTTTALRRRRSSKWKDVRNHRLFFDRIGAHLGIKNPEDWYQVSTSDIRRLGGQVLLDDYYDESLYNALRTLYPEYELYPWKFRSAPRGTWEDLENQRRFFDWAGKQLGIPTTSDSSSSSSSSFQEAWYNVNPDDFRRLGGNTLLKNYYNDSFYNAIKAVYSEVQWLPWKFQTVPRRFWEDLANQRWFFDWASEQLGITTASTTTATTTTTTNNHHDHHHHHHDDDDDDSSNNRFVEAWYRISADEIRKLGGGTLLAAYYHDSLIKALQTVYPEYEWHPWRFEQCRVTRHSFDDAPGGDLRRFFEAVARDLHIRDDRLEEWYRVSMDQIYEYAGSRGILRRNGGSLYAALKKAYPQYPWDKERFHTSRGKKASQRWLRVVLQQMIPNEEVMEEYSHPEVCFRGSEREEEQKQEQQPTPMQLDLWVPSLSLAFEYHGQQHYHNMHFFGDPSKLKERDREKAALCRDAGITLVAVPYWWDRTAESLAATVLKARPDLARVAPALAAAAARGSPIPDEVPEQVRRLALRTVDLMMLAETWDGKMDPTGWCMTEKLDGIRAFWDGAKLVSRQGKPIRAPPRFTEGLPPGLQLDGELWIDRGAFQQIMGISKHPQSPVWDSVKYCVFDAPSLPGGYEARIAALQQQLAFATTTTIGTTATAATDDDDDDAKNTNANANANAMAAATAVPKHVWLVLPQRCRSREHLARVLEDTVRGGGEGLVLRRPDSPYEYGRSASMLKVKPKYDAEVVVLGTNPSNRGLKCQQVDGQQIVVECSSETFAAPPAPGTVITVTHDGVLKSGKLRYPYFLRVRGDVSSWDDYIASHGHAHAHGRKHSADTGNVVSTSSTSSSSSSLLPSDTTTTTTTTTTTATTNSS